MRNIKMGFSDRLYAYFVAVVIIKAGNAPSC